MDLIKNTLKEKKSQYHGQATSFTITCLSPATKMPPWNILCAYMFMCVHTQTFSQSCSRMKRDL